MPAPSLPDRLQADLLVARKARNDAAVTALRTTLAAFSNDRILHEQLAIREQAADEYDRIGQPDAAVRVREEIAVLQRYEK